MYRSFAVRFACAAFVGFALAIAGLGCAPEPDIEAPPEEEPEHELEPEEAPEPEPDLEPEAEADPEEPTWWKGQLHAHTLWSDGQVFPEMAAAKYQELGFHFLTYTDHDILPRDEAFPAFEDYLTGMIDEGIIPAGFAAGFWPMGHDGKVWVNKTQRGYEPEDLEPYRQRFGEDWVETTELDGDTLVRVQPIDEFRHLVEEPGEFLLMEGVELTGISNIHLLAINVTEPIPPFVPEDEATPVQKIQNHLDNIAEAAQAEDGPVLDVLAHPNYGGAVTAEHMIELDDVRVFEVYNGHRSTLNFGDEYRKDTDRMWDIVLAHRLSEGEGPLLYGIATDDTHSYEWESHSAAGRGWVMVRSDELAPDSIVNAVLDGDFYATTGVKLNDIRHENGALTVEVDAEPDVNYTIQFIGTRAGADLSSEPVENEHGEPMTREKTYRRDLAHNRDILDHDDSEEPYAVTRQYSSDIGEVLYEVEGTEATYEFEGDELYVRAKVVSDKVHPNPFVRPRRGEEFEVAWIQPVQPANGE